MYSCKSFLKISTTFCFIVTSTRMLRHRIISFRYVSAAFELVSQARGVEKDKGWRKLTGDHHHGSHDDITAFVIPIHSWCLIQCSKTSIHHHHVYWYSKSSIHSSPFVQFWGLWSSYLRKVHKDKKKIEQMDF